MHLGATYLAHPVALAPMEEHTNYPFRLLMKQHGASYVRTERVDAVDVARRERRAMRLLHTTPAEKPRGGQISGRDPLVMAEAARVIEAQGFDVVDLNFECPIRRLIGRGEGGALLGDPPAVERIAQAVVKAVTIPVTIKIRTGPDAATETAVEICRRCEAVGVAGVDVHARSVAQAYVGGPDWAVVARVKSAVRMLVLGSGGIREAKDALRLRAETGADGVGIGRGCLGNPWIFREARALWFRERQPRGPTRVERGRAALQLVEGEFQLLGAGPALRRLARTSCYFAKFLPDFADYRQKVHQVHDLQAFRRLIKEFFGCK
jgi:tRNA-dihydrouridine synthase B